MRKLDPILLEDLFKDRNRIRLIEKVEPDRSRTPSMVLAVILFLVFMIRLFVRGV